MDILLQLLKESPFLLIMLFLIGTASLFAPKIKGYFGEKSVAFLLLGLDESKYKVINNIMLKIGDKTMDISRTKGTLM